MSQFASHVFGRDKRRNKSSPQHVSHSLLGVFSKRENYRNISYFFLFYFKVLKILSCKHRSFAIMLLIFLFVYFLGI